MAINPIGILDEPGARDIGGVSQMNQGVYNACGIACMLMLLRDCGLATNEPVAKWSHAIDVEQNGTTAADLGRMAEALGGQPEYGEAAQYPYVELVRYNLLPIQNPAYAGQTFLHWIVRESDTTFFDPLWVQAMAGRRETIKGALDDAEIQAPFWRVGLGNARVTGNAGYAAAPAGLTREEKMFVLKVSAQSWRVRTSPRRDAATVGVLRQGEFVNGIAVLSDGRDRWAAVPLSVGSVQLSALDEATAETRGVAEGYMLFGGGWSVIG